MSFITIPHPDDGDNIEVEYVYHPGNHGQRDKYGAPETPNERGEVNIIKVCIVETGSEIDYEEWAERIEDAIWRSLKEYEE